MVDDVRGIATGSYLEEAVDRYHDRAFCNDEDAVVVKREAIDVDRIVVSPSLHPCLLPIIDGGGGTRAAARYSISHRGEEEATKACSIATTSEYQLVRCYLLEGLLN